MGVHLYCILPAGEAPPPGLTGVENEAIELIPADGLGVWYSRHAAPPAPSIEAVRAHNAVVLAGMNRDVTPMPVRFGQWLDTDAAVVERVAADADRWTARLAMFAGRAEYGVTVALAGAEAARDVRAGHAETGTSYMQQLARRQAGAAQRRSVADRIAEDIAERVGPYAIETRIEIPAAGDVIARIAHLVAWADADAYHGVMRGIYDTRHDVRLHTTGPWPPYSFA